MRQLTKAFILKVCVIVALRISASDPGGAASPYLDYDGTLKAVHVGAVAPDIIGVTLWAGKITSSSRIPPRASLFSYSVT